MTKEQTRSVGKNVLVGVEDNQLHIAISLKERHGDSKSGKTITVATTGGLKPVPGHPTLRYGINVFEVKPKGTTTEAAAA